MEPVRKIRFKRQTPEMWEYVNPILEEAEPGYEKGTGRMKVGDGVTRWNDLPYFVLIVPNPPAGSTNAAVAAHINDPEPHPVYDNGVSLELLYQNAKV